MCGMLFVIYESTVFSSALANIDRSKMGLYKVLFGFGMGIMLTNFRMCGMMLVFRASLYSCAR